MAGDLRDLELGTDTEEDGHPQLIDKRTSIDDIPSLGRRSRETLPLSFGAFQKILYTTCLAAALAALCVFGGIAAYRMKARGI